MEDNFYSSLNRHDAHVLVWRNLHDAHVLLRQDMLMTEYFNVWLEVDKLLDERRIVEKWGQGSKQDKDDRAAELAKLNAEIAALIARGKKPAPPASVVEKTTPAQTTATPAAVALGALVEAAKTEPVDRKWPMKKSALIDKHAQQWPTIKRDFLDASNNGLSSAAKAPRFGYWFESAALKWAEQRGKLTSEKQQSPVNSVFDIAGKKHIMKG